MHQVPGIEVNQAARKEDTPQLVEVDKKVFLIKVEQDEMAVSAIKAVVGERESRVRDLMKMCVRQVNGAAARDRQDRGRDIRTMPLPDMRRKLTPDARDAASELQNSMLPIKCQ